MRWEDEERKVRMEGDGRKWEMEKQGAREMKRKVKGGGEEGGSDKERKVKKQRGEGRKRGRKKEY